MDKWMNKWINIFEQQGSNIFSRNKYQDMI